MFIDVCSKQERIKNKGEFTNGKKYAMGSIKICKGTRKRALFNRHAHRHW